MRNKQKNQKNFQKGDSRPNQRKDHKPKRDQNKAPKVQISLFGQHAVEAAWTNPKRHIHTLYITEKALPNMDKALQKAHDMGLKRPSPEIVDKSMLDNNLPQGSVHQGIGLSCQDLEGSDIQEMIIQGDAMLEQGAGRHVLVMLDQVTDPHNVGAIIRSTCAFGAHGIVMQKKHAPELKGVLAKTACGGVEHVPVAYETNLTRSIEALQEAGYFALGLDERGEQDIGALPPYDKCVIVLGAEGDGLRRLVREQCDILTRLPTDGPIASLNVSNAAVVALYAITSKN